MGKKNGKKAHKAPPAAPLPSTPVAAPSAPRLVTSSPRSTPLTASSSSVTVTAGFTGTAGGLFDQHSLASSSVGTRSIRSRGSHSSLASLGSISAPLSLNHIGSTSPPSPPATPTSSALGHLRAHLLSDDASRLAKVTQEQLKEPENEPRKLRKRKPTTGSESAGTNEGEGDRGERASLLSFETAETAEERAEEDLPGELTTPVSIAVVEVLPLQPSPLPTVATSQEPTFSSSEQAKMQTSSEKTLILSPTTRSSWALSYVLAGPRYGLSLAQSSTSLALRTTKSTLSLPFSLAQQLPLVGSHLPSFPFDSPSSSPTSSPSFPSPASESNEKQDAQGIVWDAVGLGLGVGLVSLWAVGAGASMVWDKVGTRKGENKA